MSYTYYLKANIYSNNLENLRKNKGKITECQLGKEKKKMAVKFFFVINTPARQHFWKRNIN